MASPGAPILLTVQIWNTSPSSDGLTYRADWTELTGRLLEELIGAGAAIRFAGESSDLALLEGGIRSSEGATAPDIFEARAFAALADVDPARHATALAALDGFCETNDVHVMWVGSDDARVVLRGKRRAAAS